MKILQCLPRRMRFTAERASSVELCVAEWTSHSRYRQSTTVVAEASDAPPLLDIPVHRLPPPRKPTSLQLAWEVRKIAPRFDLIVSQQHVPTTARIRALSRSRPLVLQTHNYIPPIENGRFARIANAIRRRELASMSGITMVSHAVREQFHKDWPGVDVPTEIVSTGFDFSIWKTDTQPEDIILVNGRCVEAKGILESALACAEFLSHNPSWRAIFILSLVEDADYDARVVAALDRVKDRVRIYRDIPFAEVRALTARCKIAIVASKWNEPFGRTALEAHAARVALISSGTGGLREVSGPNAVYLDAITPEQICRAIAGLAGDEERRNRLVHDALAFAETNFSLGSPGQAAGSSAISARLDAFFELVVEKSRR